MGKFNQYSAAGVADRLCCRIRALRRTSGAASQAWLRSARECGVSARVRRVCGRFRSSSLILGLPASWRRGPRGGSEAAPAGPTGWVCKYADGSNATRPAVDSTRDAAASGRVLTPAKVGICPALRSHGGTRRGRFILLVRSVCLVVEASSSRPLRRYSEDVAGR